MATLEEIALDVFSGGSQPAGPDLESIALQVFGGQPFQPRTKQDFLSEQGVDFLLKTNPELARRISVEKKPSRRGAISELGVKFTSGEEREQLSSLLRGEQQTQSGNIKLITDPFKTFGQAFAQSAAGKPAAALRGATVFTPGEGLGIDKLLNNTADFLESLRNPETKAEVQRKTEGKLFPVQEGDRWFQIDPKLIPETINAWAANVGDQVPLMIMTLTGKLIGKAVGKPVGAAAGTLAGLATAGPDPTDIVTVPAVALATSKVIEHLGGAIPLIALEAGGFMDRSEQVGIDKDIAEKYARPYSVASGAVEYAQVLWNLKAFKRLTGPAKKTIIKKVLTELGGAAFEGAEEVTQGGLENFFLGKAIDEQKQRDPNFEAKKPKILEGAKRQFVIGAGVSLITRGFGKGTRLALDISDDAQNEVDQTTQEVVTANQEDPEAAVGPETGAEPVVEAPKTGIKAKPPTEAVEGEVEELKELAEMTSDEFIESLKSPDDVDAETAEDTSRMAFAPNFNKQDTIINEIETEDGKVNIRQETSKSFYAEQDGVVLGFIDGGSSAGVPGQFSIAVETDRRNQGIGAQLGKEFLTKNPKAQSGGLSSGGEAVLRKAHELLIGEVDKITKPDKISDMGKERKIKRPTLTPDEISDMAKWIDLGGHEQALEQLKKKNIKFIDGYHVTTADAVESIKKDGIEAGSDLYGRKDAVSFFADIDDITNAIPFLATKDNPNMVVIRFSLPVDKIQNLSWDGLFNSQFDTYSGFRSTEDIPGGAIRETAGFVLPTAEEFKAGKRIRLAQPTPTAEKPVTQEVKGKPDSAQVPRENVAEFVTEKPPVKVKEDGKPIPVPVETGEFIATGEKRQRGFSKSVESEAVEKGLVEFLEDIPEFNQVNLKEQGKFASDLIKSDPEKARRVAMGEEAAPKGVIPEMVMIAVANKAVADGDTDILRDIAVSSKLTAEATKMGQRIRALGELGDLSPVKAMKAVVASREKAAERRKKGAVAQSKKTDVKKIKESIAKAKPKNGQKLLDDFITSLQC